MDAGGSSGRGEGATSDLEDAGGSPVSTAPRERRKDFSPAAGQQAPTPDTVAFATFDGDT
jgi:hypothetical protein